MKRPALTFVVVGLAACAPLASIPRAVALDRECVPAVTVCTQEELDTIPVAVYANPHWLMQFTPSGYSDFGVYTLPPFPRSDPRLPGGPDPLHEMFSGEWAAAIAYNGMEPIWLESCFRYPEWKTNSNFQILQEVLFPDDPDADGILEGSSVIANDHLEVTIRYDFDNTGTGVAMGRGMAREEPYELSNPFVLRQTYEIRNITDEAITGVHLYQLSHSHPANTETPTASIAYDDLPHPAGAHQDYRFDISGFATNSGLIDGFPTGSTFRDHVGLSANVAPNAHGLGSYRGHNPGDAGLPQTGGMKPVVGEHCDIEGQSLANEAFLANDEVAGSMRFDLGTILPNETKSVTVQLAFQSRARGIPAEACVQVVDASGADPVIRVTKGACQGAQAGQPLDVIQGSIADLRLAPGCSRAFDCTIISDVRCVTKAHPFDRVTVPDDAHLSDSWYMLARYAGEFTSWGDGYQGIGAPDLKRFFFTPTTAPDVDACDAIP